MGRRTCNLVQPKKRKEKYANQFAKTEANRARKRKKHLKKHPNNIRGMEKIREALGMT